MCRLSWHQGNVEKNDFCKPFLGLLALAAIPLESKCAMIMPHQRSTLANPTFLMPKSSGYTVGGVV